MNLFEKIDLFEKMANSQLSQDQSNDSDTEVFENTDKSGSAKRQKDSIKSRAKLLKSMLG